ncbi:hypothetical protein Tco_0508791 [Tanacetum coccineum]
MYAFSSIISDGTIKAKAALFDNVDIPLLGDYIVKPVALLSPATPKTAILALAQSTSRVFLLEAVEKRFGGNVATKKTQRNLLKQQYENFTTSSTERNKPKIDTLSLDDLYNNMKIYELEVKGISSSSTNTQNVAFVSSNNTSSTTRAVNTVHGATTASTQATTINSTTIDNLSDVVICAFFASQPNSPQLDNEDLQQIYPDDLEEMD